MKVVNLINFYKELQEPKGVFSAKLSLTDKSHLISLLEDLAQLLGIFDKEQIAEAKEIGIESTPQVLIPEGTDELLVERFTKKRIEALSEDVNIDFGKYKFTDKIKDIEIESTPYFFIKVFVEKEFSEL